MKRLVALFAMVLIVGTAFAGDVSERTHSTEIWSDYSYYRFVPENLPNPGGVTKGLVDYQIDGTTVRERWIVFKLDAQFPAVSVLIPNPAAMLGAVPGKTVTILIYADDHLIEVFDMDSFRTYNKALAATYADELQRAFSFSTQNEREWPETAERNLIFEGLEFDRDEIASAAAKAADPCETACRNTWLSCYQSCGGSDPCMARCDRDWEQCMSNCPNADVDFDGVVNQYDNCLWTPNPNQANCDGDAEGDACDDLNANYVNVGGDDTCMTDKDTHFFYFDFEHHVEQRQTDMSGCGAPDRYNRRIRSDTTCVNVSDYACCWGLASSISAVGDNPHYWCDPSVRNRDYCH